MFDRILNLSKEQEFELRMKYELNKETIRQSDIDSIMVSHKYVTSQYEFVQKYWNVIDKYLFSHYNTYEMDFLMAHVDEVDIYNVIIRHMNFPVIYDLINNDSPFKERLINEDVHFSTFIYIKNLGLNHLNGTFTRLIGDIFQSVEWINRLYPFLRDCKTFNVDVTVAPEKELYIEITFVNIFFERNTITLMLITDEIFVDGENTMCKYRLYSHSSTFPTLSIDSKPVNDSQLILERVIFQEICRRVHPDYI